MDIDEIRDFVSNDESLLFNGCFKESVVRFDLSTRREKRGFYIESFNSFIDVHRSISNSIQFQDAILAQKSKKCQKEASRLLDIVYEY